jgi:hypothetical protein
MRKNSDSLASKASAMGLSRRHILSGRLSLDGVIQSMHRFRQSGGALSYFPCDRLPPVLGYRSDYRSVIAKLDLSVTRRTVKAESNTALY